MSAPEASVQIPGRSHARDTTPLPAGREANGERFAILSPHRATGILCAIAIVAGASGSGGLGLSPAEGVGYGLGIFGLAAMVLLLTYSLRKRVRALSRAGSMARWFEFHLVLGLLGPTAILYHSDFQIGSMNSTISLACMLAVAGSGVGGRFLYGRMHRSLAGSRRTIGGFLKQARQEANRIDSVLEEAPEARAILEGFAERAARTPSLFVLPLEVLGIRLRARRLRSKAKRVIRTTRSGQAGARQIDASLDAYFALVCRGVELRLFERLFDLWHAIHVPLTFIMFISAAIHVMAVHLY